MKRSALLSLFAAALLSSQGASALTIQQVPSELPRVHVQSAGAAVIPALDLQAGSLLPAPVFDLAAPSFAPVPAPEQAPTPVGDKLAELAKTAAPDLTAAADARKTGEESSGAGQNLINALTGEKSAPAVSAETPASFDILGKLGVREKILAGGGLTRLPDGSIAPVAKPLRVAMFDNDDNALYLRTKIYLRRKGTREEVSLTTPQFAVVRPDIGKRGPYADYELFYKDEPDGGSYRDFVDQRNPDIFPADVDEIVAQVEAGMWRGPSYFPFKIALDGDETAPWVGVVTSRGHQAANMARGYGRLAEKGLLKRPPREELIFAAGVGGAIDKIVPFEMKIPERKVEVLIELLDLVESIPSPNGRHTLSYSDDDLDMITRVIARLHQEQVGGRRWPHVKIVLFSTGLKNEKVTVLTVEGMK